MARELGDEADYACGWCPPASPRAFPFSAFGVGVGVKVNVSQVERVAAQTKESAMTLGNYLFKGLQSFMPF
jgi:hypothetical protein